jgi:hypothetical protein
MLFVKNGRDSIQQARAGAACSIRVGDCVQVDGTRASAVLYGADEIEVAHRP